MIFCNKIQPQMQAEVILASSTADAATLYTLRGRLPRCIWPEVLTHRKKSRNGRSSRAVPVSKMIEEIMDDPFVPWHWGANQSGMQAGEECNEHINIFHDNGDIELYPQKREEAWLYARDHAVRHAKAFDNAGYHKQIVNRLLEPFMWIDVVLSSTDWINFSWLREHKDAEPHLQDWADLVGKAIHAANVQKLAPGEWHLPYITEQDYIDVRDKLTGHGVLRKVPTEKEINTLLLKISSSRCARVSYKLFDGTNPSINDDLALYEKLMSSDRIHASPMEHQGTPDVWVTNELLEEGGFFIEEASHGNFEGWIQHRKLIPGECHT